MKIKLSKSQWQMIGKKAGWMKKAQVQQQAQPAQAQPAQAQPAQAQPADPNKVTSEEYNNFLKTIVPNATEGVEINQQQFDQIQSKINELKKKNPSFDFLNEICPLNANGKLILN